MRYCTEYGHVVRARQLTLHQVGTGTGFYPTPNCRAGCVYLRVGFIDRVVIHTRTRFCLMMKTYEQKTIEVGVEKEFI